MVAERSPRGESDSRRGPPTAAEVLLPVWGDKYVRQFLRFGLPPLLAPGNLPSVARTLPTRFVLLTSERDEPTIRRHKAFLELSELVDTECRSVDHLISAGNHSTTITIAFAEAIARSGPTKTDTCFFLLMSDYLMADGSLQSVVQRMQQGASALLAGNFQIATERALPPLQRLTRMGKHYAPTSRELVRFALRHLHPATVGNTVNLPFNHNAHTNRLFWRVDQSTLLGRFYLMHPVCVRPEQEAFVIGSSLDYSFVPEMCPSGRVEVVCDSDEYLVVEMQPGSHESGLLRIGPLRAERLARSLSEWTTAEHRSNVRHAQVFHAGDLPDELADVAAESDRFVDAVTARLSRRAQPHRNHPYWRGAVAAFYDSHRNTAAVSRYPFVYGLPSSRHSPRALLARAKNIVNGTAPNVRVWDREWVDFRPVKTEVRRVMSRRSSAILHVAKSPTAWGVWLVDQTAKDTRLSVHRRCIAQVVGGLGDADLPRELDLCLIEAQLDEVASLRRALAILLPALRMNGRVVVSLEFGHSAAESLAGLAQRGLTVVSQYFVSAHPLQRAGLGLARRTYHLIRAQPWFGVPLAVSTGPFALFSAALGNLTSARRARKPSSLTSCSRFILVLEKSDVPGNDKAGAVAAGRTNPARPERSPVDSSAR